MSDVLLRKTLRGSAANWNREAEIEVYENGGVRIQQTGEPVDVVLLTAEQIRRIARASEKAGNSRLQR